MIGDGTTSTIQLGGSFRDEAKPKAYANPPILITYTMVPNSESFPEVVRATSGSGGRHRRAPDDSA